VKNFLRAKAHYLARGPVCGRDAVLIWGAGMTGRRLSKHLVREGVPVAGYIDVDPKKIGGTLRGKPIYSKDELQKVWAGYNRPLLLTAVRARKARPLIRESLQELRFEEETHWLAAA
jgi:FlaA1/EpsC-like NDP-sugar epimerase